MMHTKALVADQGKMVCVGRQEHFEMIQQRWCV